MPIIELCIHDTALMLLTPPAPLTDDDGMLLKTGAGPAKGENLFVHDGMIEEVLGGLNEAGDKTDLDTDDDECVAKCACVATTATAATAAVAVAQKLQICYSLCV